MNIQPIAYAHNGFTDKFGIPRQVREHTLLRTRIVFCPPYRNDDILCKVPAWKFEKVEGRTA